MNGSRSDASTSTDDVKDRPLCLFYFTHPFGVLSPEPPTIAAAPPHIARAFVNMEPVSPFTFWGTPTDDSYNPASSESRPSYELGDATVHRNPVRVVSVARTRKCTLDFGRRESLSSSLFSGDVWYNSSSSCASNEYPRRLIPYNRILPPLRLPSPRDTPDSDDLWPKKCLNPEKFSLPPIEMPVVEVKVVQSRKMSFEGGGGASSVESPQPAREPRGARRERRRRLGVHKPRHAVRLGDMRRVLATLMRRALKGCADRGVSPALRDALNTIREAWAEPRSLLTRCRAVNRTCLECERVELQPRVLAPRSPHRAAAMLERAQIAELPPQPGASPGLLRRRYSVPETIMRKYRLAQQRSDTEESPPATDRSPPSATPPRDTCCSTCDTPHRFARRDRELMRKSALLRRMWGRPCEPCRSCCRCGEPPPPSLQRGLETRSLDGSRSELRHLSSGLVSSRHSNGAGWATPKRQRLDSACDFRGSDEMLRAAMRNSYDRAEESRHDRATRAELSDCCTYRSHRPETSSYMETATDGFTDCECSKLNALAQYSDERSSDTTTMEIKSSTVEDTPAASGNSFARQARTDDPSLTDTSDTYSASFPTTKETYKTTGPNFGEQISRSAHIDGRISERSVSVDNEDTNLLPYDKALTIETPSYEVLEIVVSEMLNSSAIPAITTQSPERESVKHTLKPPPMNLKSLQNINIDEYVSNILVESLNSLTDQLECMNASIGNDRKISIVEKEIKVKLQNTGVNTIVHLSPTSNNQIIFGNEELCNSDGRKDGCNNTRNPRDSITIREELLHSIESNNNLTSAVTTADVGDLRPGDSRCPCDTFEIRHDNVNKAVLQQIQKLFRDELHNLDSDIGYLNKVMPEISHIEISNVDVFIDNKSDPSMVPVDTVQVHASRKTDDCEAISGVGTGNYYHVVDDNPVVPRFSAFPHTDSMEVNTSSSDDAELIGSDCTSLVDSLEDPNSPRSILLRRSFNNRRSELVRSAIDVLDLLPENVHHEDVQPKDKGESFFIRIKDNECDCDKENVKVADHMPEKIKQRLYRRHHKRELRMECARRSRVKQMKRDAERQRYSEAYRSKKETERECMAIVNALIDDVIAKIAQEEYKCMRIKQRPSRMIISKSDENITKRNWNKELEPIETSDVLKISKNGEIRFKCTDTQKERHRGNRHQIHGKLSLLTRPTMASDDRGPKRIYQKSEIHEGNKCIEILEILEYVNGSQSSPETATSDENQNHSSKNKKSRIPVPMQRSPTDNSYKYRNVKNSAPPREHNGNTSQVITDMLLEALADGDRSDNRLQSAEPQRRAPLSLAEPRSRSNSLRFKRIFDIIPEERSSLSLESGNEDANQNRRASAPGIVDERRGTYVDCGSSPSAVGDAETSGPRPTVEPLKKTKDTKSASTSPIAEGAADSLRSKNQMTMTSPSSKSAATSPLRGEANVSSKRGMTSRGRAWLGFGRADAHAPLEEGSKSRSTEAERMRDRRSVTSQSKRHAADARRTTRPTQGERAETLVPGADRPERRPRIPDRLDRDERARRRAARPPRGHSETRECGVPDEVCPLAAPQREDTYENTEKHKSQTISLERSDEDTVPSDKPPEFKCGGEVSSSDSSESGGSLLCSLAPKWLAQARHRRAARRRGSAPASPPPRSPTPPPPAPRPAHQIPGPGLSAGAVAGAGGWSVTVAGSCRAALPADVEMRLRFPHERPHDASNESPCHRAHGDALCQECTCPHWSACAWSARAECAPRGSRAPPLPAAAAPRRHLHHHAHARTDSSKLTLTMKKEALDSSILASKSSKNSSDPLPDLETYRASRSKVKSSVKTRRGYSLHCWLPGNEPAPIRESNGLSVLGCAIIPELKPRVPTMSERDLTRIYTPRHYLRS